MSRIECVGDDGACEGRQGRRAGRQSADPGTGSTDSFCYDQWARKRCGSSANFCSTVASSKRAAHSTASWRPLRGARSGIPAFVVASGGNAGLAHAYAAQLLGIPATVFVPQAAPEVKVGCIRGYGAEYAEA
jgi:hypothetical protein